MDVVTFTLKVELNHGLVPLKDGMDRDADDKLIFLRGGGGSLLRVCVFSGTVWFDMA